MQDANSNQVPLSKVLACAYILAEWVKASEFKRFSGALTQLVDALETQPLPYKRVKPYSNT